MRDVAVVSFAQTPYKRREDRLTEVEMVMSVVTRAITDSGIAKDEIGFTCSGSSDYIAGQAFAFVGAIDALGAWPPICESHVEMDGAWALYEAWVKIQCGAADSALVFAFGRASMGTLRETLTMQLDPYTLAPVFWVTSRRETPRRCWKSFYCGMKASRRAAATRLRPCPATRLSPSWYSSCSGGSAPRGLKWAGLWPH